ncbi:heavy metal-associated isoprenylated plant protein 3-like [Triticum urartu]|nr:heavy metal-associated isoprenylated plant protein 3-like [Triticum urartu]XP_048536894.1 heavy metal-associated isoprenylated plant protein 3-like [Triticum urartu]
MGKKKKRSGGGGGGGGGGEGGGGCGGGQHEEKPEADAGSGCEGQPKDKPADDKDKDKGGGGCKDDKADKDKDKGCGGKDDKGGKDKEKKAPPPLPVVTAVLKVDMHCDGCAHRIRASVRRFPGVEGVAMEVDKGSMTVVGRFDAKKLQARVASKTRKKVDLVGGKDNKGGGGGGDKDKCGDGGGDKNKCADGEGKKEEEKKEQDDKCGGGNAGKGKGGKDNKKPAVPVIVTVVLKIGSAGLHCDGCMHRIRCKLFKIKGVEQVKMDPAKNQVTVTGTMDAKALPEKLRKKLRRPVDVVAPGKGDNKDKEKDGCNKDGKPQQQQQQGGDGKQCKEAAEKALAAELQLWKTAFYDQQAMQATEFLLSDENPNACAVM